MSATLNALMDITSHKFYRSIFNHIQNPKIKAWFRTPDSWKLKYEWDTGKIIGRKKWNGIRIPSQLTDSWHFAKMWMIIFLCLAIVLYKPIYGGLIDFVLYGLMWNFSFSFHYNITFKTD